MLAIYVSPFNPPIPLPLSPSLSLSFYPPPSITLSLFASLSLSSLSLYPSPSIPSLYSPLSIPLPLPPSLHHFILPSLLPPFSLLPPPRCSQAKMPSRYQAPLTRHRPETLLS